MSACIFSVPLCLGMVASISSKAARLSSMVLAVRSLPSAARYWAVTLAGIERLYVVRSLCGRASQEARGLL